MSEQEQLAQRIAELTGWRAQTRVAIVTDTSDCMRIQRGDVVRVEGHDFLIKGNRYETRFGIEYQPKYWVFSAIDLATGEEKILKTVFHEDFNVHIGLLKVHCYRSPEKEARVLDLVKGDHRFMQGYTVFDEPGNNVRVIDTIHGETIFNHIVGIHKPHEQYFHEDLPGLLRRLQVSIEAIAFLHEHGTCHGDVRNDHIIIETDTGRFRWIDFDLKQHVADFDVWSIGNIISYAVGKGIQSFQNIMRDHTTPQEVKDSLTAADASAFYEYRVMNLKKLFPYIPDRLNGILMHYVARPDAVYTNCDELLDDYAGMLATEFGTPASDGAGGNT